MFCLQTPFQIKGIKDIYLLWSYFGLHHKQGSPKIYLQEPVSLFWGRSLFGWSFASVIYVEYLLYSYLCCARYRFYLEDFHLIPLSDSNIKFLTGNEQIDLIPNNKWHVRCITKCKHCKNLILLIILPFLPWQTFP